MKKRYIVLGCVLCMALLALVWWLVPTHFLGGVTPKDVGKIEIFNGTSGREYVLSDPEQIAFVVEHIQQVPMKKDYIGLGMGTLFRMQFVNTDGKDMAFFIVNSEDSIRQGMMFYECDGELEQVVEYLEEIEDSLFPEKEDSD